MCPDRTTPTPLRSPRSSSRGKCERERRSAVATGLSPRSWRRLVLLSSAGCDRRRVSLRRRTETGRDPSQNRIWVSSVPDPGAGLTTPRSRNGTGDTQIAAADIEPVAAPGPIDCDAHRTTRRRTLARYSISASGNRVDHCPRTPAQQRVAEWCSRSRMSVISSVGSLRHCEQTPRTSPETFGGDRCSVE